jgi:hypothetical protein
MAEQIGINDLRLFPEYTRESYEAVCGAQAPPFDNTKPVKTWFDPAGAGAYSQLVNGAPPSFAPLVMSPSEAKTVNLPGMYRYPKYVRAATPAVFVWAGSARPQFPSGWLATDQQAAEIAAELGTSPFLPTEDVIEWRGETRRNWVVLAGGQQHYVGTLFEQKSFYGVGSPGKWALENCAPTWNPAPQPTQPLDNRIVPMPVRTLAGDEEFASTPFGWLVRKKGSEPVPAPASDTAEILRLVTAVAKTLGIL